MAKNSKRHSDKSTNSQNKQAKPNVSKPASIKSKSTKTASDKNLWNTLDGFFGKHLNAVLYSCIFFSVIFGGFLFDVKISTGGDDSHYIEMANDFLKGRSFPTWHGPLYSVFLSLPILIFGVNVVWLKIFSFIFVIAHLILFFQTFKKHLSPTLFTLVMLIIAINSTILYFASQTYSEAMFMFLQSLMMFIFIKTYLNYGSSQNMPLKKEALQWLILGFVVFLASLTRNIGIVGLVAMLLFLLIEKRFKSTVMLLLSYIVFLLPFRLYKSLVWDKGISQGPDQISEILRKNPYNRAMGTEDFAGMVDRFLLNAKSYLSKHFMVGIGLNDPTSTDKSGLVTLIIFILFLIGVYFAFRRSKIMLFVAIYLAGSVSATFIALHQSWDQMRMVVIYIPMLLLFIAWGIYQFSQNKRYTFVGVALLILLLVVFFKTFNQTADKMKVNRKILVRNIKGDHYYGFTPDWQNFLKMSEWVGKNIPSDELVASRKPSMSYIYSKGREFFGMYRFPTEEPGEFIGKLKQRTGELMVIPNKSLNQQWPISIQWAIKQSNVACVAEGNDLFGVYRFQGIKGNELLQLLNQHNVHPFSTDSLLRRLSVSKQNTFAVSPDTLIRNLKKSDVEYAIVASLRANPNMNTGNIINNIQRYFFFVEQKYPGILNLVHQIGADAAEPAWLYKINYSFYKL